MIAYADDLMILTKGKTEVEVENYANKKKQKVAMWARVNKIIFNDQKSKLMILKRRKPKIKRDFKIYLNNKILQQEDTMKYLGVIIDRRFNFNEHIEYITGKCIKLIHALSKSAKINWGLRRSSNNTRRSNITYIILRSTGLDSAVHEIITLQNLKECRD